MSNKSMGNLILELRKSKNMTQQDLAEKMNVTDKAVSKWERGISYPDITTISKLAEILDTTTDELLNANKIEKEEMKGNSVENQQKQDIIGIVLKAVGLAMGVATFVLNIIGEVESVDSLKLLSIGVICIGISLFRNK